MRRIEHDRCGERRAVQPRYAVPEFQSPRCEPLDAPRIDDVLLREHACGETVLVVAGEHRNRRLYDHRSTVEFGRDEVNTGAVHAVSGLDHTSMRVQAWIAREQ